MWLPTFYLSLPRKYIRVFVESLSPIKCIFQTKQYSLTCVTGVGEGMCGMGEGVYGMGEGVCGMGEGVYGRDE